LAEYRRANATGAIVGAQDLDKSPLPTPREKTLSVFGSTDFRAYLQDFYACRKDGTRGYSFRAFSKAAGFTSPNILKLVIDGERNISPEATQKFIKALGLKGQMAEYFATLVRMNQAKSDADKEYYFAILQKLTPQAKRRDLSAESLKYLSHWLYPVIREMVSLKDFRDDPYWIARRVIGTSSTTEIGQALQFLLKEGFIEKTDGKCTPADNMVLSSDEVRSLAIRNYHRAMLDQAKESLENLPVEEREFGALTFVLPEAALAELKYKMKNFRRELHTWAMQIAEEQGGEIVVQVNSQMYPHTRKVTA
jgi:uncharacterized protein (TIGR02147 family)